MIVKLINLAVADGLIDPVTKRRPFVDPATGQAIATPVDVPDTSHWYRRIREGDIARVDEPAPSGMEPVAPLTTRGGK